MKWRGFLSVLHGKRIMSDRKLSKPLCLKCDNCPFTATNGPERGRQHIVNPLPVGPLYTTEHILKSNKFDSDFKKNIVRYTTGAKLGYFRIKKCSHIWLSLSSAQLCPGLFHNIELQINLPKLDLRLTMSIPILLFIYI